MYLNDALKDKQATMFKPPPKLFNTSRVSRYVDQFLFLTLVSFLEKSLLIPTSRSQILMVNTVSFLEKILLIPTNHSEILMVNTVWNKDVVFYNWNSTLICLFSYCHTDCWISNKLFFPWKYFFFLYKNILLSIVATIRLKPKKKERKLVRKTQGYQQRLEPTF